MKDALSKLFMHPLPSSRSGSFYNSFPYPTKISPETIAIYVSCGTDPGDTVLDAFSGSGSTGIAALLSEHPTEKMIAMAHEFGVEPTWGTRNAILYEVGTYATFATKTITNRLTFREYTNAVERFINKAEKLVGKFYYTKDPNGKDGIIRYTIWTEFLSCPYCGTEIDYFTHGTSRNPATFKDTIVCPHCNNKAPVDSMAFVTEEFYDRLLGKNISRKKRRIAWLYGTTNGVNWDRIANAEDNKFVQDMDNAFFYFDAPRSIEWGDLYRAGYHYGITHLHHFYTLRNYRVFYELWELAGTFPERESDALKLLLLSYNSTHCTLMTRVVAKRKTRDFVLTGAQSGVLYISKLPVEKNILLGLKRKAKPFAEVYKTLEQCNGNIEVRNLSSRKMIEPDNSIDFVFTDPPFGDFIPYAEVNQINELWLPNTTDRREEVIISNAQQKDIGTYKDLLAQVFSEISRVVKDDSPVAVVFHAAKAAIWNAFSAAIHAAKLDIQQSSLLDKTQASFKQVVSQASVQGDPLFLLKKSFTNKTGIQNEEKILQQIIKENPHSTEIEQRHCYSLYIGKCLENGISVKKDAKQVYSYIQRLLGDNKV